MHPVSITQAILLGIMAAAPFVFGAPVEAQGLARREISARVPPPDEFGSWEDKRDVPPPDEFGSWEKRSAELEVRHHTEAQIAAKEAAAAAAGGKTCKSKRSPHHTEAQIAAKEAAAAAAGGTATTTATATPSDNCE